MDFFRVDHQHSIRSPVSGESSVDQHAAYSAFIFSGHLRVKLSFCCIQRVWRGNAISCGRCSSRVPIKSFIRVHDYVGWGLRAGLYIETDLPYLVVLSVRYNLTPRFELDCSLLLSSNELS